MLLLPLHYILRHCRSMPSSLTLINCSWHRARTNYLLSAGEFRGLAGVAVFLGEGVDHQPRTELAQGRSSSAGALGREEGRGGGGFHRRGGILLGGRGRVSRVPVFAVFPAREGAMIKADYHIIYLKRKKHTHTHTMIYVFHNTCTILRTYCCTVLFIYIYLFYASAVVHVLCVNVCIFFFSFSFFEPLPPTSQTPPMLYARGIYLCVCVFPKTLL